PGHCVSLFGAVGDRRERRPLPPMGSRRCRAVDDRLSRLSSRAHVALRSLPRCSGRPFRSAIGLRTTSAAPPLTPDASSSLRGRICCVRTKPIYVEILIEAEMERVWELTQDTDAHPRWDLRFSSITPTGTTSEGANRFRYELRIPGHTLAGTGISLG